MSAASTPSRALRGRLWRLLSRLASLKLTLAILVLLAVGVVAAYLSDTRTVWALVLPLTLCAINLMAAIASNGIFRRQLPLLVFHLCLLALIVLVALGRMTYLKGQLELTDGTWFEGQLSAVEAGPWHFGRLDQVRFASDGFRIDYDPGMRRGPTRNAVRFLDASGAVGQAVIGDQTPLTLCGYRFYTSHNKGFAPTFAWTPAGGAGSVTGSVHLPAYPLHEYRQARNWRLPESGIEAWTMLQFDGALIDPERADEFKLPAEHVLVLRVGDRRWTLQPGQYVVLPGGRLTYQGLRAWMGYTVFYDWTIPWLLAAAVSATVALGWHFWRKFASQPWDGVEVPDGDGNA